MSDWKTSDDPESRQRRIRSGFYPDEYFPVSYSSIERYELCPLWWKFENVDRLGRETGEAAEMGNVLHNIQQELAELGLQATHDYVSAMVPLTKSKEYKSLKAALDKVIIKREYLYSTEQRYHWEWMEFRKRDSQLLTVQFEAKIDLIFVDPLEPWLEIADGKSSRAVLPNIDDNPQGLAYAVVITNHSEFELFKDEDILFTQLQWAKGEVVSTKFSAERIKEWQLFLEEKIRAMIDDQEYKPKTGVHCQWCPFLFKCEAAQKKLPELLQLGDEEFKVHIDNWEDAVRIAEGIAQLRAIYLRLEKGLAGYMKFVDRAEGWKGLDIPSGKYSFEAVDGRRLEGGMDSLLERHPEEKENIRGSWYTRLTLKRKT